GGIVINTQVFIGNLLVSAVLAFVLYRIRYRRVLEYDEGRFVLRVGQRTIEAPWKDFSTVSLVHKGFEILAVRLYRTHPDDPDYVEIPASELGLDASAFRFEVMEHIRRG
ncbi:MAG: hypothetical protein ACYTHM_20930, partial [Planctomycetota bacterium]